MLSGRVNSMLGTKIWKKTNSLNWLGYSYPSKGTPFQSSMGEWWICQNYHGFVDSPPPYCWVFRIKFIEVYYKSPCLGRAKVLGLCCRQEGDYKAGCLGGSLFLFKLFFCLTNKWSLIFLKHYILINKELSGQFWSRLTLYGRLVIGVRYLGHCVMRSGERVAFYQN